MAFSKVQAGKVHWGRLNGYVQRDVYLTLCSFGRNMAGAHRAPDTMVVDCRICVAKAYKVPELRENPTGRGAA